jgi:hypothetical protein
METRIEKTMTLKLEDKSPPVKTGSLPIELSIKHAVTTIEMITNIKDLLTSGAN